VTPKGCRLKAAAESFEPNARVKGFSWAFSDDWREHPAEGAVMKIEVVARVEELREFHDGRRWIVRVLEVGRAYD
jgi:hypothetical protein